jgi:hypothetical protein
MVQMSDHFVQIDRANGGVRLTVRRGPEPNSEVLDTLIRHVWMNETVWSITKQTWLGRQQVWADTPVHAWKDHQRLGTVEDLAQGRIDEHANHG